MARAINSDDKLVDSKQIYLNNGDLVVVKDGAKSIHYLVSSYLDPENPRTADHCVLTQLETGNKLSRFPNKRTTDMKELLRSINLSYYHKKYLITKSDVTIVGRDFYDINIKVV